MANDKAPKAKKETTGKFLVRAYVTDPTSKRGFKRLGKVGRVASVADGIKAAQKGADALGDQVSTLVRIEIIPEPVLSAGDTFGA